MNELKDGDEVTVTITTEATVTEIDGQLGLSFTGGYLGVEDERITKITPEPTDG